MSAVPVRVYGLEVRPGDILTHANLSDLPASVHITMAAIDPNAPVGAFEPESYAPSSSTGRVTLKILRVKHDDDDEDDEDYEDIGDDDDIDAIERRLQGAISDEDDSEESSDDEVNGGPSDPAKSKKAKKAAAAKQLLAALAAEDSDDDMDDAPNGINGKGKGKASDDDESISSVEGDDEEIEQFVVCTLDPEKNWQQPINITIGENEDVMFQAIGTHSIFLTGNYVVDPQDLHADDDEDDYDSDEDDLDYGLGEDDYDEDEESDELDDIEDPRITEVESEDEAPKLVKADKKGKNKRAAEDEIAGLDELIQKASKSTEAAAKGQAKKKQKNNAGEAAPVAEPSSAEKKGDKKVQFAKNLEQGPTGSPLPKKDEKPKAALGKKTLSGGIVIDDKKLGSGPAAKSGNKIEMRYIGKLENGKVFDSNKKGAPFSFKLGKGEVIKGWDVGVAGMQVGGERRIICPPSMAYGSKSLPGIPANSTLIFDVKMLSAK